MNKLSKVLILSEREADESLYVGLDTENEGFVGGYMVW